MNSKEIGILGERIGKKYLERKGYEILERNYFSRFVSGPLRGEIDIVARKSDMLFFVEVKSLAYRNNKGRALFISPEDKVDFIKQRKIIKTAEGWLTENKMSLEIKWQIDVLAIEIDLTKRRAKIKHLKNAVEG